MKRCLTLSLLTLFVFIITGATGLAQYKMGAHYIGANATVVTEPVGWGINYEFGFDERIGLGLVIRYWAPEEGKHYESTGTGTLQRSTIMTQFQAAYHFLPQARFDPYGGLRLGYSIYDENWQTSGIVSRTKPAARAESGITMSIMGGFRYFVSPKISIDGTLEHFVVNDDNYFENQSASALMFSVNFTLD
ncbi:MAG: outer membrane beta-barrel protein [Bacteroidetes bacterium]|nr:outer membrane beta-barrel protein [Bacteroidota bacterium]